MNCYYHGMVQGHIYSDVSLSTCSGLSGFISLENRSYVLEPSTDPSSGSHRIYRSEQLNLTPGSCGHGFNISLVHGDTQDSHNQSDSPFGAFSTR
ncbi:zinc metalloproteinase/disintegrin-like, partial [Oncorhynchus keta]|uniref:zinc metalloproteinase/disintegrin-like n=1 Tax=Oncorhynchus keta TaxID=8018 RepID=UPI00227A90AA